MRRARAVRPIGPPRPVARGRLLTGVALGVLLVASLTAFAAIRSPITVVVPAAPGPQEPPAVASIRATVGNEQRPVVSVREASQWNIVIALDPPLSTERGLRSATRLLAEQAELLVSLGPVRIVSIDRDVVELLPPTQDTEELRQALTAAAGIGSTDRMAQLRSAAGPVGDRLGRLEAAQEELQLLRWQREALVDWLIETDIEQPKALFLLEDGFDFRTESFYGLSQGQLAGTPSPVFDDRILGVALAATGWIVHPLEAAVADSTYDRTEVGIPLAEATGGRPVARSDDLVEALGWLAGAIELDIEVDPFPGGPMPFAVALEDLDISPPRWVGGAFVPGRSASQARSHLLGAEDASIPVTAEILYDGPDPDSVVIEVRAELDPRLTPPNTAWLSLALYLDQLDAAPLEIELQGQGVDLRGVDRWVAQCALDLPDDPGELVAVVTDAVSGRWGAGSVIDEADVLSRGAPGIVIEQFDLRPPRETKDETVAPDTVVRLLAPSGENLSGRKRFQTLVTTGAVSSVVFYLDDKQVAKDTEPPFSARIDLGRRPERHTVRVNAYDPLDRLIGSDSIRLNEPMRSFDVSIGSLTPTAAGGLSVAAGVSHPTDVTVERVEVYFNQTLIEELTAPPWNAEIPPQGEIGVTDYVRVVAYLDDGRFLEDVRLLASPGAGESVEVNLVQVYAVATDRDGEPVADLNAEDFTLRMGGKPQQIQRFAFADEVPLLLGLVIDTSPSMWTLIHDTKKAAARFLTQVITDNDQALTIDFDTRPRLAAPLTGDITQLLLSLGSMDAEPRGTTALYDSVIFGALQLPAGQDRKALVLLTDGDDYKSKFGAPRAIDTAKQAGVPVYVVSLAGLHDPRRQYRRTDLDVLTGNTGGQAYYLGAMGELADTYDRIAKELRSQYLLAFPTDRQLSEKDLESIKVTVDRPGVRLRTVVGGRSVN